MQVKDWGTTPTKIEFGEDMVLADVAIDKDHTISLYTEKEMSEKYDFWITISKRSTVRDTLVDEMGEW